MEVAQLDTNNIPSNFTINNGFNPASLTGFVLEGIGTAQKSFMIVADGEQPITLSGITNNSIAGINTSIVTGSLNPSIIQTKIKHPPFSLGFRPKVEKIVFSTGAI